MKILSFYLCLALIPHVKNIRPVLLQEYPSTGFFSVCHQAVADYLKAPNRVKRAPWAHQGTHAKFMHFFLIFPAHAKKMNEIAWNGARRIPRPCQHFGRHGFWFWEFLFLVFFGIPNFWIPRLPDLQISRFPDLQISRCPDSKISRHRQTNSQIPIWPQRSNTSQAMPRPCIFQKDNTEGAIWIYFRKLENYRMLPNRSLFSVLFVGFWIYINYYEPLALPIGLLILVLYSNISKQNFSL